jgi:hypothetical protein
MKPSIITSFVITLWVFATAPVMSMDKVAQDSLPLSKQKSSISVIENDKSIKIVTEDNQVTLLEIDGKTIEPSEYAQHQDIIDRYKPRSGGNSFYFGFGNGREFGDQDIDDMIKRIPRFDFGDMGNMPQFQMRGFNNMDSLIENFNFGNMDSLLRGFQFDMKNYDDGDFGNRMQEWPGLSDQFETMEPEKVNDYQSIIGNALNSDGFLIPGEMNSIELTGKHLKINGEKQPTNIWKKYKRIFEEESGLVLEPKSKLNFKIEGKIAKRKYRTF